MHRKTSNRLKNLIFRLSIKSPVAALVVILLVIVAFYLMFKLWGFNIF